MEEINIERTDFYGVGEDYFGGPDFEAEGMNDMAKHMGPHDE